MTDVPDAIHKAAFLGPKGENADELERLLQEVLRDHVFWRRNFHPSDPRLIGERDKRSEAYDEMTARMRDELFQILSKLKRAAPLYSPRQVAHIVSDPSLPALVGYFAGMLYNQNNVVAEVSPETVREEREYFAALAQMVGYPEFVPETLPEDARTRRTPYSWGHLCSGGTIANLEALWIARNVRLYPLAVRLLAEQEDAFAGFADWEVTHATGETARLRDFSTYELSNLPIDEITDLHLRIKAHLGRGERARAEAFQDALPSVRKAGLASFLLQYNDAFPNDRARLPKVLISQATHYCWQKNMDLVGLGGDALETVPVDQHIRLDTNALAERLRTHHDDEQPVLSVVSICGTTEEGAIDPIHEVEALRDEVAGAGLTFWHHCDAAFGGYFTSMLPKDEHGTILPRDVQANGHAAPSDILADSSYEGLRGIAETDSITIDPHKFGYVPYPAGAVLFRDYHVRDAIAYRAPYLADNDEAGFGGFLGQWTLEGSRPGAAAVSCYLSQKMVPLEPAGHGRFMEGCIEANQALVDALQDRFAQSDAEITLRPFHTPETVAFCFVLAPPEVESVEQLNALNERIWQRMTVDGREDINQYDFLLSKTQVDVDGYRHVLANLLPEAALDAAAPGTKLTLLRTCLMNPFQHDWEQAGGDDAFSTQFAQYLHTVALEEHLEHALAPAPSTQTGRVPITVVEQAPGQRSGLARRMEEDERAVTHFDVRACVAADLGATDDEAAPTAGSPARERLRQSQHVVFHVDAAAPAPVCRLAERLVAGGTVAPRQATAVVTGNGDREAVRTRLRAAGLAPDRIIAETDGGTAAMRLLARLVRTVRPEAATA